MLDTCRALLLRLAALFRRRRLDEDLEAELRSHLEMAVDFNLRRGLTAEDARREALRDFGGVEQTKEIYREQRGLPLIETTLQDVRFGLRILRRSPGFSLLALLCLTVGIGANAAVLSWIEGILFRPFPAVAHQERLMAMVGSARGEPGNPDVSWPDFVDFRSGCPRIEAFIAEKITGVTLTIGERAERATGSVVSSNYFDALGVRPILGRGFEPAEEVGRNAHPVTVISYRIWKDRYGGDPAIVGRAQALNGLPHTIVGVAPEGFYGTFVGYAFDFWVPASMQAHFDSTGYTLEDRGARWIEGFVRLGPGVSAAQAQEEISAVARRLEADHPDTNRGHGVRLMPLWQTPFNNAGALLPTLGTALAVVILVLLIACANVSNLLLVRSFARRHEMTLRLAIGCGRARLLRQLLTEGLVLSGMAAAGGLVVAYALRNALVLLVPWRGVPMYLPGELDGRVFALSVAVCLLSTLLFGLFPALQTNRLDLAGALKSESGGVVGARGRARVRWGLVLLQVSLSFVLIVGAVLVVQSLQRIRTARPGFATEDVLITGVNLYAAGYDVERARTFEDELIDRVRALPGVRSAAYARIPPFSFVSYSRAPIAVDGYVPPPDEQLAADYDEVGPDYFETLGIPLLSGRGFTRADDQDAAPVAIVNEVMAARYWPGADPLGARLRVKDRWMRVVGVARVSKYRNFLEAPQPLFYVPLRQNFFRQVVLHVRTREAPRALAAALGQQIRALDPSLAPQQVITLREQVDRMTSAQRVAVVILGVFGGVAVLLSAIGLYGVMSYSVSQGTRELGLRMALGADAADLLRLVMAKGLAVTAAGIVLGAAVALLSTRLLGYLLYGVSPRDPVAFASALAVMMAASLAACLLPAWRATRIDPLRALRD